MVPSGVWAFRLNLGLRCRSSFLRGIIDVGRLRIWGYPNYATIPSLEVSVTAGPCEGVFGSWTLRRIR